MKKDVTHLIVAVIAFCVIDGLAVLYYVNACNSWTIFSLLRIYGILVIEVFTIMALIYKIKNKKISHLDDLSNPKIYMRHKLNGPNSLLFYLNASIVMIFIVVNWIFTAFLIFSPISYPVFPYLYGYDIGAILFWIYICVIYFKSTNIGMVEGWTFITCECIIMNFINILFQLCLFVIYNICTMDNIIDLSTMYELCVVFTYTLAIGILSFLPFLLINEQDRKLTKRLWYLYSSGILMLIATGALIYLWHNYNHTNAWSVGFCNMFTLQYIFILALNVINIFVTLPTLRKKYRPPFDRPIKEIWKAFA